MSIIAVGLILVLTALAGLHLYWGFGGFWPGTDAVSLSQHVAGTSRPVASKLTSCAVVAAALFSAAAIVFAAQQAIGDGFPALVVYGGHVAMILVFGLRGLAPYVTSAFDYARETPFFELNRRYYAPLCLLVALGLVLTFPPGLGRAVSQFFGAG